MTYHRNRWLMLLLPWILTAASGGFAFAEPAVGDRAPVFCDPPSGFVDLGPWSGSGPAPVFVTFTLNINDFLRPEREAQAVHRFLDTTTRLGIPVVELSFTGHVLEALQEADPGLIERIRKSRPTIRQHYRLIRYAGLVSTERDLYRTDPRTLEIDRSRPGPLVLIQRVFGVTPLEGGGTIADRLRADWETGDATRALQAHGLESIDKNNILFHPHRLVGSVLDCRATDGHPGVDAYLSIRRRMERLASGASSSVGEARSLFDELARAAQWARAAGSDPGTLPEVSRWLDVRRIPEFTATFDKVRPTDGDRARFEAALSRDPDGTARALTEAWRALAAGLSHAGTPAEEVRAKLNRLRSDRVYAARVSWHATDDYTLETWSSRLGNIRRPPLQMRPASPRPMGQQEAICRAFDAVLETLASHPRVQAVSLHHDTQWANANSPGIGYPRALGVEWNRVPDAIDLPAVEGSARRERKPGSGLPR